MAKVDWITWKTNPKEVIDKEKVKENLDNKTNDIYFIVNEIFNNVKNEIENGGLNKESLNINGESPNNVYGNKILSRIDEIRVSLDNLKNKINRETEEQKKLEKEQLIKAIEEKIIEQENILENTKSLKTKVNTSSNNIVDSKELDDIIISTNEKIEVLKKRLEEAKGL